MKRKIATILRRAACRLDPIKVYTPGIDRQQLVVNLSAAQGFDSKAVEAMRRTTVQRHRARY